MPKRSLLSSRGQTAVFVFILLLVGLTIGLSLATRTVQDLKSSVGSDLSSRAFAAAEAGVEEALRQDLNLISDGQPRVATFSANNTRFSYTVLKTNTFGQTIARDNVVQLKLRADGGGAYFTGNLQIYWVRRTDTVENPTGCGSNCNRPSLELTFISTSGTLTRYAVNSETKVNGFQQPDGTTSGSVTNSQPNYVQGQATDATYTNLVTISIAAANNYEAVRIRTLYNKGSVKVSGINLPPNVFVITSEGIAADAVKRVVQVTRTIPSLPPIFDYVLFNGSTQILTK